MSAHDPKRTLIATTLTWIKDAHGLFSDKIRFRSSEAFSLKWGCTGFGNHEEMALAVLSRGATFTIRGVQPIQRRWP